MRKMQRFVAFGLAGTMALSLAACGGSAVSTDTASTAESTASSTGAAADTAADSAASGDEVVTLNWALWDKDSAAYWQALADGYMGATPTSRSR